MQSTSRRNIISSSSMTSSSHSHSHSHVYHHAKFRCEFCTTRVIRVAQCDVAIIICVYTILYIYTYIYIYIVAFLARFSILRLILFFCNENERVRELLARFRYLSSACCTMLTSSVISSETCLFFFLLYIYAALQGRRTSPADSSS